MTPSSSASRASARRYRDEHLANGPRRRIYEQTSEVRDRQCSAQIDSRRLFEVTQGSPLRGAGSSVYDTVSHAENPDRRWDEAGCRLLSPPHAGHQTRSKPNRGKPAARETSTASAHDATRLSGVSARRVKTIGTRPPMTMPAP